MPIFGRRQLQLMLNDLGPWLVRGKAKDLLNRLENREPDQALPAEYELALTWAVSRVATLEIDKRMGERTPDIYSSDLLANCPVAADVAAVSDVSLSGDALMRRAANIINLACDEILKSASEHLHYSFQERSGYFATTKGRRRFARDRQITNAFQMDTLLRAALKDWLRGGRPTEPLRWRSEHIDVVISWRDYVHPLTNTFSSMPSLAYDLRKNPLYKVLKSKARQLKEVPVGVRRAIFLGDAGCRLLSDINRADSVNQTFSGQQIINTFLADGNSVDFVLVFSSKRAKERSLDTFKNPRIWYVYVFEQQRSRMQTEDLNRFFMLRDSLPAPYLTGYEAHSWHQQGMFSPQGRGHYLPTSMSIGRKSMTIKISARALHELMAGKLTSEQFKHWTVGENNPFKLQLGEGRTISNVRFEGKNVAADDDYLIFEFRDDPAAAPLCLPDRLKSEE
jgi:hypothetical protein